MRLTRALLLPALVCLSATPALADANAMRAALAGGACFRRDYDAGHLAAHPDQRVTRIALARDTAAPGADLIVLTVAVAFRGSDEVFAGSAYCAASAAGLACGMEGDAGAFTLAPAKGGAILLTVDPGGMGFEGAARFETLSGTTGDDRVFLLPAAAPDRCAVLR